MKLFTVNCYNGHSALKGGDNKFAIDWRNCGLCIAIHYQSKHGPNLHTIVLTNKYRLLTEDKEFTSKLKRTCSTPYLPSQISVSFFIL